MDANVLSQEVYENLGAQHCLMPMGITSEKVTEKFKIKREDMDQMAFESHQKAAKNSKLLQ